MPDNSGSSRICREKIPSVTTRSASRATPWSRTGPGSRRSRRHVRPALGHPLGAGAGGDPARFQHDDFLVSEPRLIEQRQRHSRGLAGAGRCHQHGGVVVGERPREIVEHRVDRKGAVEAAGHEFIRCVNYSLSLHLREEGRGHGLIELSCPSIHVFTYRSENKTFRKQDVDGRDKHGHHETSHGLTRINSVVRTRGRRSHR